MHNTPLRLFPDESETIAGVGRAVREGRTSCAAVLERCFHQIDLWDGKVNAWVFIDRAGAMRQARALDAELNAKTCRGPLHGIPFGIKDVIDVAGMPTACGFPPWRGRVAERDAALVQSLREDGAVILGKTVTTQFAWIDPPPTRNPWNLERTPGGSSSGSAAAVATGMCLAAIGSQTGGSIIRPASFCGVAGFKPPHGVVNVSGVFPFAPSLDHPGPIARTVEDLGLIADSLFERREASANPISRPPRLFRPRGFFDRRAEPDVLDAFEAALDSLSAAGAEIVEAADDAFDFENIIMEHRLIMAAEAAATHEELFQKHRDEYAPQIRRLVEEGLATATTHYIRSELAWRKASRDMRLLLPEGSDFVVTPATLGAAPEASTTGNPCFNSPWSYLGWAAVSFPIGLSPDGMPLAIQIVEPDPSGFPLANAFWCESAIRRSYSSGSS